MSRASRTMAFGALAVGLAALGCQAPPQAPSSAKPRSVFRTGPLKLGPDTDLALAFHQPCGEGYRLAQAAAGPLDPRIAFMAVKVTEVGGGVVWAQTLTQAAIGDQCEFDLQLTELPLGSYDVAIEMLDASQKRVAHGGDRVTITDVDKAHVAQIQCDFKSGGLVVCLGPCPGTSPTPTPQPSTLPSVVPSAGPTVGPAPNPADHFERIHGIHADDEGTVYLFGLRPSPWPDAYHIGRTVEVTSNGAMRELKRNPLAPTRERLGENYVYYEGDISTKSAPAPENLYTFAGIPELLYNTKFLHSSNSTTMRLDDGAQYIRPLWPWPEGHFVRPWGANALVDKLGASHYIAPGSSDPAKLASYIIGVTVGAPSTANATVVVDRRGLTGGRSQAMERPLSMVFDRVTRAPVWSCKLGILTKGTRPTSPPVTLVPRSAYGLAKVSETSRELLFTTYEDGDTAVRYVDLASGPTPAVKEAFRFSYGAPHRIERGADGFFYVLLAEPPLPFDAASGDPYMYEFPGKREVRVVRLRFDAATKTLVEPRLIVNSFNSPLASW